MNDAGRAVEVLRSIHGDFESANIDMEQAVDLISDQKLKKIAKSKSFDTFVGENSRTKMAYFLTVGLSGDAVIIGRGVKLFVKEYFKLSFRLV